jgi:hypothetical protein
MASFACLLSGLEVFNESYQEHNKYLRVLKGVHGFHIYATEHWTEYLLSYVASEGGFNLDSCFVKLACQLANKLDEIVIRGSPLEVDPELSVSDQRLALLGHQPALCKHIKAALKARSLKLLERGLVHNQSKSHS